MCLKTTTVTDDGGSVTALVCEAPEEAHCVYNSDCMVPLVCGRDEICRNQCVTDVDCVTSQDQKCTPSGVCALPATIDPLTGDVPLVTAGRTADGGVFASGSAGASGAAGATGAAGSGAAGATGAAEDRALRAREPQDRALRARAPRAQQERAVGGGGAGSSGTCGAGCGPGTQCVSGACQPCGAVNEVCCGTTCNSNLTCAAGMCSCGGKGQACCQATTCGSQLTCTANVCACGGAGQPCCPGDSSCSTGLVCGGLACGCITGCDGSTVLKPDNTVWYGSPLTKLTNADASAFVATSISTNGYFGCGVKSDGSVWCWGQNSYGDLGSGSTASMTAMYPLQVVTNSTATTPLMGISSVSVSESSGDIACAVAATTGAVWCWGYGAQGQIGNGYTFNYPYAVPVTTDMTSGIQFSGVKQISVGYEHVCAVKTDKTVWCWGENNYGQLGLGTTGDTPPVVNPAQVTNLANTATSVATLSYYNTCASTVDGGVWCWGYNGYNYLGNTTATTTQNQPIQVMISAGATTPLTNVTQVLDFSQSSSKACALKTDGTMWCWPGASGNYYAVPFTNNSNVPVTSITTVGRGCYLDADDKLWVGISPGPTLTCP